jgi:ABC-type glutathione transport system ATPase component
VERPHLVAQDPLLTKPPIRTRGLTKDYGQGRGLFDLDLEVERGEIFGFLGPNGAGKSTTMRLLLDLIAPTSGSASVMDLDTRADGLAIRRRVGFLPGDFALYPRLTWEAMLDYLGALRGGVDRRRRDELADRFGADLHRPVRELSTGNRQKLGLRPKTGRDRRQLEGHRGTVLAIRSPRSSSTSASNAATLSGRGERSLKSGLCGSSRS